MAEAITITAWPYAPGGVFAWAVMLAGLSGSLAAHAGENFGVVVLGTFAALVST